MDDLSDNSVTAKSSGAYNATSYASKNVVTKENFCLMDDPFKVNLQGKMTDLNYGRNQCGIIRQWQTVGWSR